MKDGYIHFRHINGCYKPYSTTSGTYTVATGTCEADGGYLIKLNNATEKDAIKTIFGASSGKMLFFPSTMNMF